MEGRTPEGSAASAIDTLSGLVHGVFVTIQLHKKLRGCMGIMGSTKPLPELIRNVAQLAAYSDPRFPPMDMDEIRQASIEVTLLGDFERLTESELHTPEATLLIGKHGLYIRKGDYSGILLPQVAIENNFGAEEFLEALCAKAGLPPREWSRGAAVSRFEAVWVSE